MIAIPARTRDDQLLITTIFGRCEQVALVDDNDNIEVKPNPFSGGVDLANWLLEQGVDTVVMRNMGANPYLTLHRAGARVFASTKNRAPVSEIVRDLHENRLLEVTPENMHEHLKAGKHRHPHAEGHSHAPTREV